MRSSLSLNNPNLKFKFKLFFLKVSISSSSTKYVVDPTNYFCIGMILFQKHSYILIIKVSHVSRTEVIFIIQQIKKLFSHGGTSRSKLLYMFFFKE